MGGESRPDFGPVVGLIGIWSLTLVAVPLFVWGFGDSLSGPDRLGVGWLIVLALIVLALVGNAAAQTVIRVRELRARRG